MNESSFDLFKSFSEELDPEILQRKFLLSLLKLQKVERGSIWIKKADRYHCIEAVGVESENVKGISLNAKKQSIVGWVIENGKMTIADPRKDIRHYKELEEKLAVKSSLILCFPLFLRDRKVYGAVQIIDTDPQKNRVNLDQEYLSHIQDLINVGSIALSNAIIYSKQVRETELLKHALEEIKGDSQIVGQCPAFLKSMDLVKSYARSDFHVLITGESGTGKELASKEIHRLGSRRDKPFLVQNCSAIPATLLESELFGYKKGAFSGALNDKIGLFEAANGGTVFLDEIGDMPVNLQASILRVIQNNEIKPVGETTVKIVDVRIISATNRDIKKMVAENEFRQDLFYRLSVLPLHIPPLRERKEDIPLLVSYFIKKEASRIDAPVKKMRANAMKRLIAYPWPGNIRELENLIRYLLVVSDKEYIDTEGLPAHIDEKTHIHIGDIKGLHAPDMSASMSEAPVSDKELSFSNMTWEEVERAYVFHLLKKNNWNVTWAAVDAGVNRSTFASRMNRLGIKK